MKTESQSTAPAPVPEEVEQKVWELNKQTFDAIAAGDLELSNKINIEQLTPLLEQIHASGQKPSQALAELMSNIWPEILFSDEAIQQLQDEANSMPQAGCEGVCTHEVSLYYSITLNGEGGAYVVDAASDVAGSLLPELQALEAGDSLTIKPEYLKTCYVDNLPDFDGW